MALTEPIVLLMGGTATAASLFCASCEHYFMHDSGEWDENPDEPDVREMPLSQLVAALTQHKCSKGTS